MNATTAKHIGFFFRLILSIVLTLFVVRNEYNLLYHQQLYVGVIGFPIYVFIIILYLLIVTADIFAFKNRKKKYLFLPSILGALLLTLSIFINYHRHQTFNQKTLYQARSSWINTKESNYRYIIDFKENHHYIVFETLDDGLMTNYYYGNYSKKGNQLILDNKIGKFKMSNKLKINTIKNTDVSAKKKMYLVQTDDQGREIDSSLKFKFSVKNHTP